MGHPGAALSVRLLVPDDLRFFLRPRERSAAVTVTADGTSSLGHLVQSAGIPLTEVGELRIGDSEVCATYRPAGGETVVVGPVPRPQRLPAGPRFLLDVHLGSLARRLRLLGVDTAYSTAATDDELVAAALVESRMLLTQDRGLLRRTAVRATAAFVRGQDVDTQLADVLDRFRVPLAPGTRCPACNALLANVAKADVLDRLQAGTARSYDVFWRCVGCGRVYWRGAHADRLRAVVEAAARVVHRPG